MDRAGMQTHKPRASPARAKENRATQNATEEASKCHSDGATDLRRRTHSTRNLRTLSCAKAKMTSLESTYRRRGLGKIKPLPQM